MRLRTVRGTRFPTKCACGCGQRIPPDPDLKVVVDFDTSRPRLTYLPTHSPDYSSRAAGGPQSSVGVSEIDLFEPASAFVARAEARKIDAPPPPRPPTPAKPTPELAHASADTTASPQAGRAWATSQLTFNAGQFESVRFGYADYAQDGENEAQLRSRVHEVVLAEVERQVRAVRVLHERLGDRSIVTAFARSSAARS
jgi:hypothetical protein